MSYILSRPGSFFSFEDGKYLTRKWFVEAVRKVSSMSMHYAGKAAMTAA